MSRGVKAALLGAVGVAVVVFAYVLRAVFLPLVVALVLAYILNPLIEALERRCVPRVVSIAALYAVLGIALAAALVWGLPAAWRQGQELVASLTNPDSHIRGFLDRGGHRLRDVVGPHHWDQIVENLKEKIRDPEAVGAGGRLLGAFVAWATRSAGAFFEAASFVALVPVYLFFLLKNLNPGWRRAQALIPPAYRRSVQSTLGRIHRTTSAYLRGQLMVSGIEGVLVLIVLAMLGVRLSFLFGAMYAVLSMLPYLGVGIGLVTMELFVLVDTGGFGPEFFGVAALFAGIQVLETCLLQPVLIGRETGLHPIAIILALLIAGQLWGVLGMLIAVPLASTAKILVQDYVWPGGVAGAGPAPS